MDAKTLGDMCAYPVSPEMERDATGSSWGSGGLTKREAFAMAAMQGLLANPETTRAFCAGECSGTLQGAAVYHADELLAELAKVTP